MSKYYFKKLQKYLEGEWARGAKVFPVRERIFHALNTLPMDQVCRSLPTSWSVTRSKIV